MRAMLATFNGSAPLLGTTALCASGGSATGVHLSHGGRAAVSAPTDAKERHGMNDTDLRRYAEAFCRRTDTDWLLTKKIGSGNSGSVYQVTRGKEDAALKIYHPRSLPMIEGG